MATSGKNIAQIPKIQLISDLIVTNADQVQAVHKNRKIIETTSHINHIMKVHRNHFLCPEILNNTHKFRMGISASRRFLPAFLKIFHKHTIAHMHNAHEMIHQKIHPELDDVL